MSMDTILGLIGLAGGTLSGFMLGSITKSVRITGFGLLLLSLFGFAYFAESKARTDEQERAALMKKIFFLSKTANDQSEAVQEFRDCFNRRMDELDTVNNVLGCRVPRDQ
ncbi:hypothetical protein [Planktotalea sp.]|uniref:hypothetical protein n=1 Tax=Planktotalea sp. TaxID=2029877 RepID=UPI003F6D07C0